MPTVAPRPCVCGSTITPTWLPTTWHTSRLADTMMRSSASLPHSAQDSAKDLVLRARRASEDAQDRFSSNERGTRGLSGEDHDILRHERSMLSTIGLSAETKTEVRERTQKELAEWKAKTEELAAERGTVREARDEARSRFNRLEAQAASSEGLAPWDAAALEALRAWGDLPAAPLGAQALLKGSGVASLFRERLQVSRSTYYSHMRPLLRSYYLVPSELMTFAGKTARRNPGKGMRFRREEVDALIAFIETESAMLK